MALTGFDPSVVSTSVGGVKSAYDDLISALYDSMQSQIVAGMANVWACNKAQEFFGQFKTAVDALLKGSNEVFESIVKTMNTAATNWAMNTGSSYTPSSFVFSMKTISIDGIVENINGVRGIDLAQATVVANKLPRIAEQAQNAVSAAKSAVANCGFVGGSQAANLNQSLDQISNSINQAVTTLSTSAKSAIDKTVEVYQDTEGKISSAFAGGN